MVLQRKGHILLDGKGIVKRGVLKQEPHLLSDFAELVETQASDVAPVDANRSRVRFLQSDDKSK